MVLRLKKFRTGVFFFFYLISHNDGVVVYKTHINRDCLGVLLFATSTNDPICVSKSKSSQLVGCIPVKSLFFLSIIMVDDDE